MDEGWDWQRVIISTALENPTYSCILGIILILAFWLFVEGIVKYSKRDR